MHDKKPSNTRSAHASRGLAEGRGAVGELEAELLALGVIRRWASVDVAAEGAEIDALGADAPLLGSGVALAADEFSLAACAALAAEAARAAAIARAAADAGDKGADAAGRGELKLAVVAVIRMLTVGEDASGVVLAVFVTSTAEVKGLKVTVVV
jgi:hypothetical protein